MAGSAEKFRNLLKQAIAQIDSGQRRKSIIQDELGYAVGSTGRHIIQHWLKGNLPAKTKQIEALTRALAGKTSYDRGWFQKFLQASGYINQKLLDEIRPKLDAKIEQNTVLQSALQWPLVPPEQPPPIGYPVRRLQENFYFLQQLKTAHLAIITGMPGVGKTTLAVGVIEALQWPEKCCFWYTFRGQEGLDDIIWRLADFLAWHGDREFRQMLHSGHTPPATVLLDSLLYTLRGRGYLLCFDDFHLLNDEFAKQFLSALQTHLNQKGIHILLISRKMPKVTHQFTPLSGLNLTETKDLLLQHELVLSEQLIIALHTLTQGNPQLLLLAANAHKQGNRLDGLVERILETIDVETFVLAEVDEGLTEEERMIMQAVSIFMGYPSTRTAIEHVANRGNIRQTLRNLRNRHLLVSNDDGPERRYTQHGIVQNFYHNSFEDKDRVSLHLRAGLYYETEEQAYLKAALHFEQADKIEHATTFITGEKAKTLVQQGHGQSVIQLLERLIDKNEVMLKKTVQWYAICITRSLLHRLQGNYTQAIEILTLLLDEVTANEQKARIYYELGMAYDACGQFNTARIHHIQSKEQLTTVSDSVGLAQIYGGLGWAYYGLGQLENAQTHFLLSQPIAEEVQEIHLVARNNLGLGLIAWRMSFMSEEPSADTKQASLMTARAYFERSQRHFHALKETWNEADAISNLGLVYYEMGAYDQALEQWESAIDIFEQVGKTNSLITTYCNLGEFYLKQGDPRAAATYLEDAVSIAQGTEDTLMLSYAYIRLAEALLAQDRLTDAWDTTMEAKKIAEKNGYHAEQGISCRVLADIHIAQGHYEQAQTYLSQSLPLLKQTKELEDYKKAQKSLILIQQI